MCLQFIIQSENNQLISLSKSIEIFGSKDEEKQKNICTKNVETIFVHLHIGFDSARLKSTFIAIEWVWIEVWSNKCIGSLFVFCLAFKSKTLFRFFCQSNTFYTQKLVIKFVCVCVFFATHLEPMPSSFVENCAVSIFFSKQPSSMFKWTESYLKSHAGNGKNTYKSSRLYWKYWQTNWDNVIILLVGLSWICW